MVMINMEDEPDYYLDASGRVVFTAHFLLKRGYCCGNGCRHCPYEKSTGDQSGQDPVSDIEAVKRSETKPEIN